MECVKALCVLGILFGVTEAQFPSLFSDINSLMGPTFGSNPQHAYGQPLAPNPPAPSATTQSQSNKTLRQILAEKAQAQQAQANMNAGYTIIANEDTIDPASERFPLRIELLSHPKRRRRAALYHGNTPAEPHGHPAHKHPPKPPSTDHPLQFLTGKNGNPPPPLSTLSKLFGNSLNAKGSSTGGRYSAPPIAVENNPGANSRPNASPGNYEAMLMQMFDRWYQNKFGSANPEPAKPEQVAALTTTVASTSSIPLSDTNPSPAKANAISKTSSTVPSNSKPPIVASSSVEVAPYAPPPAAANPTKPPPKPAPTPFNKEALFADIMQRIKKEFFSTTKTPVAKPKMLQPAELKPEPVNPKPVNPKPPVKPVPPAEAAFPEEPAPPSKPTPSAKPKSAKKAVPKKAVSKKPAAPPVTEAPPPPEPAPATEAPPPAGPRKIDLDKLADINEGRIDQGLPMLTPDQVDVNGNILPPKPQTMFGHSHGHPHGFANNIQATHHAAHIQAGPMDPETHRQLHRILRISFPTESKKGNAKIQQRRQYEQQQIYNVANNLYRLQQQQRQYPGQYNQQLYNNYIPRTQANGQPIPQDILADIMEARANQAARARRPAA